MTEASWTVCPSRRNSQVSGIITDLIFVFAHIKNKAAFIALKPSSQREETEEFIDGPSVRLSAAAGSGRQLTALLLPTPGQPEEETPPVNVCPTLN